VPFLVYSSPKEIYQRECLLRPDASVTAWLPLDNATDDKAANDARAANQVGTWRITYHWLTEPMESREFELEF
jgi:hypothetical protein